MKKEFETNPTYKANGNTYINTKTRKYGYGKTITHDNKALKVKIPYKCHL